MTKEIFLIKLSAQYLVPVVISTVLIIIVVFFSKKSKKLCKKYSGKIFINTGCKLDEYVVVFHILTLIVDAN